MSDHEMLINTITRLEQDVQAHGRLLVVDHALGDARMYLELADNPRGLDTLAHEVSALSTLLAVSLLRVKDRARQRVTQIGWQIATYVIAPVAKESHTDDPIVWLTGNSYMPPLRSISYAESVWEVDNGELDLFTLMAESIEHRLDELRVYLASPEYDNSLYVVDLERFEHIDTDVDGETLQDDWRPINATA